MAARLTVLVPVKNESANLAACLESVRWADELFVVDSGSTDDTVAIARSFGARVVEHEYVHSAAQKNWAIPQAAHEWVLVVDADERVTPALQAEIRALLEKGPDKDMYWIHRDNWFFGKRIRHCGWAGDRVIRLFRRDAGRYEDKHVHANVIQKGFSVGSLAERFEHHTYRTFDQYLEKFNRYSTCSALDLQERGRKAGFLSLWLRPCWRFFRMYVLQRGFLDGKAGLILCGLASSQVFVRYAKLWALNEKARGAPGVDIGRTEW